MILKKIQGKSVDEARDEARRLYGEHVVVMETFAGDGKNEPASVTVLVDKPVRERTVTDATPPGNFRNVFYKRSDIARVRRNMPEVDFSARTGSGDGFDAQTGDDANPPATSRFGVPASDDADAMAPQRMSDQTLRSTSIASADARAAQFMPEQPMPSRFEPRAEGTSRLEALRRYASETDTTQSKRLIENKPQSQRFQFNAGNAFSTGDTPVAGTTPRAASRFGNPTYLQAAEPEQTARVETPEASQRNDSDLQASSILTSNSPSTQQNRPQRDVVQGKTGGSNPNPSTDGDLPLAEPRGTGSALESVRNAAFRGQEEQSRREIAALHKRFDRLESLLDNNLVAADIDLVAHPAFQQLTQSGVRPALVSRWFSGVIKKGVHPAEQPERFISELSLVVRNALEKQADKAASPIQVFVGPSGAGKTHLVMQLALYARRHGKNVAIVAVQPPGDAPYYSVLELFCASEGMSFIRSGSEQGILELQDSMQDFDMVLVDTPSLPMSKDKAWRTVWSLRQQWSVPGVKGSPDGPVTQDIPPLPAEINYVANAATGASALNYLTSLHHTLEPDVVSFTHLDEITLWGSIIPFMDEMNAPCRYLSAGTDEENGIRPYDAADVARNILKDS